MNEQIDVSGQVTWPWPCTAKAPVRSAVIGRENVNIDRRDESASLLWNFFGDPIVPDGKISGTARSSYGTVGYVRNHSHILSHHNRPMSQIPQCMRQISHNAPFYNRNVQVHISVIKWCILGYRAGTLWDQCNRSVNHGWKLTHWSLNYWTLVGKYNMYFKMRLCN